MLKLWRFGMMFLLFVSLPCVSAQAEAEGTYSGSCGENAVWEYDENTKTLMVSGTGDVTLNRKRKGYLEADIQPEKFVIGEGITSVTCYNNNHDFCFGEFKLKEVSLPESLTSIRGPLFMNCKIKELTIPKGVKELDAIPFLFANIRSLRVSKKNSHFTATKEGILFTKDGKTLVYYPISCRAKSYTIPKGVAEIAPMAFYGNFDLKEVVLTKRITRIGNGAFSYCSFLEQVNLQDTKVKQLQDYDGTIYGLQRFFGDWFIVNYYEEEDSEYDPEDISLLNDVCGYYDTNNNYWNIGENVYYFGTFQGTSMSSLEMPDSLRYAGQQTLYPNRNSAIRFSWKHFGYNPLLGGTLKKLVIGKNFRGEINGGKQGAWERKTNMDLHFNYYSDEGEQGFRLETVQVHPENQKYQVKDNILYSKNMDTVYMAANTAPSDIAFDAKVRYVARGAFYDNRSVKSVIFQGRICQIHAFAFENCRKLKTVKLTKPVDRIGRGAFNGDYKLTLQADVIRYIDAGAFRYVADMTRYDSSGKLSGQQKKMPFDSSELTYIGKQAFECCYMHFLNLDGPLQYIGRQAFEQCFELRLLSVHSTKDLTVDNLAFESCNTSKLKTASVTGDGAVMLKRAVFDCCNGIKTVELSKGTTITDNDFDDLRNSIAYEEIEIIWK